MGEFFRSSPIASKLLVIVHMLLGVGAVFGGFSLIIDTSGNLLKMPISLLKQSPFNDYLIPGIILLSLFGVVPLILAVALMKKWQWKAANKLNVFAEKHWSWTYSLYIGFALIIWITLQVYFINDVHTVHLVYMAVGLAIQILTLLPGVQNYYVNEQTPAF
ncbi:hypothetical protein CVD25_22180 [Bacillus canaveralius]|uniref:Uncharacterized protein n=1 Tax=Bacillus canaveralius TaxID=1403243 RepID=A0A2N5GP80_9BACI|nr:MULTISPECIES: hypothetical protein [Bacillus]PLR84374.1 hypothetical protein CU635_06330 [Bacillus canaveralius]PLR87043.1 hypothetical protein CVD23_05300 [Bacillus sp. V33-4]PLR88808.1 hypothetical protein CVD25_22180 [Bacillus canaveralius]RSK57912.1 hypothetical protein EJA13_00675 [Bacillus canaveralius]